MVDEAPGGQVDDVLSDVSTGLELLIRLVMAPGIPFQTPNR